MSTDPRFAGPTPFARLAMAHAASMCGDACLTVSLAGSLFFTAPTDAARGSVLLYLALTMAPFAVIAPIVGPALDRSRGGRRMMVFISCAGRAALCIFLASNLDSYTLYPLAFGVLVLAKAQSIAKSSLVPGLVKDEGELVEANSRLALISVLAAAIGGIPAAGIAKLLGSEYSLYVASIVFVVGALLAFKIPKAEQVSRDETPLEREELHAPSIILAGSAMGVLRGVVGFMTFFVAFALKDSVFSLGVALTAAGVGGFGGTVLAPYFKKVVREELILMGGLLLPAAVALFAARNGATSGVVITAGAVAIGAAAGRLGFDSIVQRDAPDAIRGRAFARFETRFQLAWVAGGLLGIIPMSRQVGLLILAAAAAFAGVSYLLGMRAAQQTVDARRRRAMRTRATVLGAMRAGVRRVANRSPAGPDEPGSGSETPRSPTSEQR